MKKGKPGNSFRKTKMTMWDSIRQGKFIEWFFGMNKKKKTKGNPTVLNLSINDVVIFDEIEYIVKNKSTYNDGGCIWYEYTLDDNGKYLFLSAEDDDELEIGIMKKVDCDIDEPIPNKIKYNKITYKLDEHSYAKVDTVGLRGNKEGEKVEYWDFECDEADEDLFCIEKWGGSDIEYYVGRSAKEYEFKILPGGGIEQQ